MVETYDQEVERLLAERVIIAARMGQSALGSRWRQERVIGAIEVLAELLTGEALEVGDSLLPVLDACGIPYLAQDGAFSIDHKWMCDHDLEDFII